MTTGVRIAAIDAVTDWRDAPGGGLGEGDMYRHGEACCSALEDLLEENQKLMGALELVAGITGTSTEANLVARRAGGGES